MQAYTGNLITELDKMVHYAMIRAELLKAPHDVNDPRHRGVCFQCLKDWYESK